MSRRIRKLLWPSPFESVNWLVVLVWLVKLSLTLSFATGFFLAWPCLQRLCPALPSASEGYHHHDTCTLTASAKTFTDTPGFDLTKMGHMDKLAPASPPSCSCPLGPTTFNSGQFTAMQALTCPLHRSNHHTLAQCQVLTGRYTVVPLTPPAASPSPATVGALGSACRAGDLLPLSVPGWCDFTLLLLLPWLLPSLLLLPVLPLPFLPWPFPSPPLVLPARPMLPPATPMLP